MRNDVRAYGKVLKFAQVQNKKNETKEQKKVELGIKEEIAKVEKAADKALTTAQNLFKSNQDAAEAIQKQNMKINKNNDKMVDQVNVLEDLMADLDSAGMKGSKLYGDIQKTKLAVEGYYESWEPVYSKIKAVV